MSAATTTHLSPMTPKSRMPRPSRDKPATSPNYFNPLVSPHTNSADQQTNLEAFRRQSESNNFALGPTNLSFFSANSDSRHASSGSTPATLQEPDRRSPSPLSSPKDVTASTKTRHAAESLNIEKRSPSQNSPPIQSSTSKYKSTGANTPSFFDLPRHRSPFTASPADIPPPRSQLSHIDERHPRNSLPHNRIDPPSPAPREPVQRAETLPNSLSTDAPNLISPQELSEILERTTPDKVLLLDVRVFPQYSQSRIDRALNLCIPTTLLKRPAFNVQKLADTFNREKEKDKFAQWREAKFIVVYDSSSFLLKDATSSVNTLKKFTNEGWQGSMCILRGGFLAFSKKYPASIDHRPASEMESTQGRKLSIDPNKPLGAPVAGGCAMPVEKSSVNPFFSTIRQNMDLIGGVGQTPVALPSNLKDDPWLLPPWLQQAASPRDKGKAVSEFFLKIEEGEQQRMQKALTGTVQYGSPTSTSPNAVRIAGIEKGTKNRYKDMLPYDHSRVRLKNVPVGECDYINASHIKSAFSGRHYIASQAPVPATIEDFWRVIWEQDVHVIVMLTAEHDGGQRKSHPYWHGRYGRYTVRVEDERQESLDAFPANSDAADAPSVLIRRIIVSGPVESRSISQLQYSSWPDFGVPTDPKHLLNLVRVSRGEVQKHEKTNHQTPVLVHCSAGCGRTGTFCTVDSVVATITTRLKDWKTEIFGPKNDANDDLIAKTVEDFRIQRLSMVQTLRQFVLCYETVLKWYSEWYLGNIEEVRAHKRSLDEVETPGAAETGGSPPKRMEYMTEDTSGSRRVGLGGFELHELREEKRESQEVKSLLK